MPDSSVVTHMNLHAWQKSIKLVTAVYKNSRDLPTEEKYGLTSQIRRCAVSIPSNIAEGAGRKGKKEFIRFLYIAIGSLCELETQLILCNEIGYQINQKELMIEIEIVRKLIYGLIRALNNR